jgi:hypothetical protein
LAACASWLNWIEAGIAVPNGAGHRRRARQAEMISTCIRERDAQLKTIFPPGDAVTWIWTGYQASVA